MWGKVDRKIVILIANRSIETKPIARTAGYPAPKLLEKRLRDSVTRGVMGFREVAYDTIPDVGGG